MGWLIGYIFCALLMFAWLVFPPWKSEQDRQQKAFNWLLDRHGRGLYAYARLWSIILLCSAFWWATLIWWLIDAAQQLEWYE
jgi:hypothetical protein